MCVCVEFNMISAYLYDFDSYAKRERARPRVSLDSKRARERDSGSSSCANSTKYVNKLDHVLEILLSE